MFDREAVSLGLAKDITDGDHLSRRAKHVSVDLDKAGEMCESAVRMFEKVHLRVIGSEAKVLEAARNSSTNIRKAANEIGEGVQRMEKMANFALLEQRVAMLERAAAAMRTLAELERDGNLKRVMQAFAGKP